MKQPKVNIGFHRVGFNHGLPKNDGFQAITSFKK
jgi:hypothetical protein